MTKAPRDDEPFLPLSIPPATGPLRERAADVRCKFCGKTLKDEGEKALRSCDACLDTAEFE